MREYDIRWTETVPVLDGRTEGTPWERANRLDVDRYNWYEEGPKPATTGWLLYDDEALYVRFEVEDRNISSEVTDLNGPTYRDSSVELFARPKPEADERYFNFEANCCGFFKLAWQEPDWEERGIDRDLIPPGLADEIRVETSIPGPTRAPRSDDEDWWLAAAIPFETLSAFTDLDLSPERDTVWRANCYRSGVETPSQMASWNPIPTAEPEYHCPEHFGRLRFA